MDSDFSETVPQLWRGLSYLFTTL